MADNVITDLRDILWGGLYQIRFIEDTDDGYTAGEQFVKCSPESTDEEKTHWEFTDVEYQEFSGDWDNNTPYEDIPDEGIVVVSQNDVDEGRVEITQIT